MTNVRRIAKVIVKKNLARVVFSHHGVVVRPAAHGGERKRRRASGARSDARFPRLSRGDGSGSDDKSVAAPRDAGGNL